MSTSLQQRDASVLSSVAAHNYALTLAFLVKPGRWITSTLCDDDKRIPHLGSAKDISMETHDSYKSSCHCSSFTSYLLHPDSSTSIPPTT